MTRVLLTGATGFLGSHIAEVLVHQGLSLRCTVRPSSSLKWLAHLNTETVTVDFSDELSLARACEGISVVVHNAGITRARHAPQFDEVNTQATLRLAQAAIRAGVSRFIFISSLEARGPDGLAGAVSAYGKSKLAAEQHLSQLSDDLEVVLLRPAGVYGPRDTDLLSLFQMAARGFLVVPGSPGQLQPIHARDVAKAVLATSHQPSQLGPFELAGSERLSWSELSSLMETVMGHSLRIFKLPRAAFLTAAAMSELLGKVTAQAPKLDRRRARSLAYYSYTCDTTTFQDAYDWQAGITLNDGLAETAEWYKDQGWL